MITSNFLALAAIAMAAAFVPSAHAEILIAVAGPMTGQYVSTGEEQHQGARLAASPSVEDPVFDSRLSGILQKALEEAARLQKADSISASLYISDQCYWEGVSGTTTQDRSAPVESDMLYGFASITKTLIAAIVLQLAEENKLGLEDMLEQWLEEYPNIDKTVTIRQLLNHTSRLYNYTHAESFWPDVEANPDRVWSPEELLRYGGGTVASE